MSLIHYLEAEASPELHTPVSAENRLPVDIGDTITITQADLDPTNLSLEATQADILAAITHFDYETVAASQTAQVMGATGGTGDYLAKLIVVPASLSPGVVTILDNATSINLFAGGASSLTELKPFVIEVGALSVSGAWKVTTGANVSVVAIGKFTA